MLLTSFAMRDKDHRIYLIPTDRIVMLTIEHANLRKIEGDRYEVECSLKLAVDGSPHPLEDIIKFTFASARKQDQEIMAEIVMVQNHIIKNIFDAGLLGEQDICSADDPACRGSGITISSAIKNRMVSSPVLTEVLETHGALPDSISFLK